MIMAFPAFPSRFRALLAQIVAPTAQVYSHFVLLAPLAVLLKGFRQAQQVRRSTFLFHGSIRAFLLQNLSRLANRMQVDAFFPKLAFVELEEFAEGLRLLVWLHYY